MERNNKDLPVDELSELADTVRTYISQGELEKCIPLICRAMESYPHAPHPHNLLGIVLEKKGDHCGAMKHFRAAWALDPTYRPASHNLSTYGTFFSKGRCAYDEKDLPPPARSNLQIVYDSYGIGRIVSKNEVYCDEKGIVRR